MPTTLSVVGRGSGAITTPSYRTRPSQCQDRCRTLRHVGKPVRNNDPRSRFGPTARGLIPVIFLTPLILLVGCGGSDRPVVTVYAASSLTDIMQQVEEQYEQQNPNVDIRVNVAGTNTLVRQLNNGAEADVFVAADVSAFDQLIDAPVEGPYVLALNTLTMVVPVSNPAAIADATDVATPNVLTARCATGVPCGNATDRFLEATGMTIGRSTDEPNVRSVLAKVSADEVDAGFVYRSDLRAASDVSEIVLPDAPQVTVGLVQLSNGTATDGLVEQLRSDEVAELFTKLGFEPVVQSGDR